MRAQVLHTHACVRHFGSLTCARAPGTSEPIRARHTSAPYWLTLVRRARHISAHAPCAQTHLSLLQARACHAPMRAPARLPATSPSKVNLPPGPCSTCASPSARGQNKGGSQAARGVASVRSAPSKRHIAPIVHVTRARVCECELGFYNEFYNAFTSETMSATKSISNAISESLNYDNVYGNRQKPPRLMNIEDYN
ncbi:hypothetical protein Hanom_Chr06g00500211 [Helianthus anomalus]